MLYRRFSRSHRRRPSQRGYTILELMTVIGILGVLVVIATTAYRNYTTRTYMLEAMLAADTCKNAVFEAYYYGEVPAAGRWGCEVDGGSTEHVQSVAVDDNGKVSVVMRGFNNADIDGKVFTFTPIVDGAPATFATARGKVLQWRCGDTVDGTTVPSVYLPFTCRGSD